MDEDKGARGGRGQEPRYPLGGGVSGDWWTRVCSGGLTGLVVLDIVCAGAVGDIVCAGRLARAGARYRMYRGLVDICRGTRGAAIWSVRGGERIFKSGQVISNPDHLQPRKNAQPRQLLVETVGPDITLYTSPILMALFMVASTTLPGRNCRPQYYPLYSRLCSWVGRIPQLVMLLKRWPPKKAWLRTSELCILTYPMACAL